MNDEVSYLMREIPRPQPAKGQYTSSSRSRITGKQFRDLYLFHELIAPPLARKRHPYFRLDPWQPATFRE